MEYTLKLNNAFICFAETLLHSATLPLLIFMHDGWYTNELENMVFSKI